ncbi:DUF1659 domain-containing protein [Salipaludibacillus sp. CUR1]|uniref:DUF1659 domain-containing protein n=1 Tax=Salipaludibacillus aurantiacus TaxID=1601833 RepID=A0A1H9T8C0_9BACI|nr:MULTISPECIES: DUF1659 domain-containing protein [Salipaludibacillus]MCE7793544.1 DUF1659 domain-containing protein [Salipaludibacillus sp. CUR1]SER93462.1 Protein of unknown function [Salipaludibacillus aurantiacus]
MNEAVFTRLSLTFLTGVDEKGNEVYQSRHFRNVKPGASNEALFTTAQSLASLQPYDLDKVERNNTYELYE